MFFNVKKVPLNKHQYKKNQVHEVINELKIKILRKQWKAFIFLLNTNDFSEIISIEYCNLKICFIFEVLIKFKTFLNWEKLQKCIWSEIYHLQKAGRIIKRDTLERTFGIQTAKT